MRDHQQRQQRGDGDQAVDLDLAVQVGPIADQPRADQGRRAAREVDERDVMLRDADVVHRVEGDIGNHREAGEDDHGGEQQRAQVVGVAQYVKHRHEGMGALLRAEVVAHLRQHAHADQDEQYDQHGDEDEGRAPLEMVGQPQRQRHARNGGDRKRRRNHAARAGAALERDHVADHGLHQRAHHPAERPGQAARDQQRGIARREPAGQRRQPEQREHRKQQAAALEAVDEGRGEQAGSGGGKAVGRDQQAELMRGDAELGDQDRPERHHDHEVEHMAELDAREGQQQISFALRGEGRMHVKLGRRSGVERILTF